MIKIISKQKYKNLTDRIDDLTFDIDYLKGENEKLEEQVKIFNDDNKFKDNMLEKEAKKVQKQKEEIAKLKIELEDCKGFLEQEKACSNALRQERDKLRNELEKLSSSKKLGRKTKIIMDDLSKDIDNSQSNEKMRDKFVKEILPEIKKRGRKPKKEIN